MPLRPSNKQDPIHVPSHEKSQSVLRTDQAMYKNICYLNKTRKTVTQECCDRYIQEHGENAASVTFKYNLGTETYPICKGMPILATANRKGKDGAQNNFNTMEFTMEKVSDSTVTVRGGLSHGRVQGAVYTVILQHQGADIQKEYNIFDVEKWTSKTLYTALSRVKPNFKNIHLDHKSLKKQYTVRKQPALELCKSYFNARTRRGRYTR